MATDKRLDQVSQLTDFDYALIVKGTDVAKVTKQQFAELVGNLLYGATTKETLASVVAEQMLLNKVKVYKKTTTAGGSGLFSGLSFVKSFFTYVVQDSDNRKFILSHTYFAENSEAPVHTIIRNNGLEFGQSNIYGTQGITGLTDTASVYIFVFI